MKMSDIVIDANKTLGSKAFLIGVSPSYKFENNIRTDKIESYKYETVFPDCNFEKVNIRIMGDKRLETPDGYVPVEFEELELSQYMFEGKYMLTGKAKNVRIVKKS